jgi:urease accessory protein
MARSHERNFQSQVLLINAVRRSRTNQSNERKTSVNASRHVSEILSRGMLAVAAELLSTASSSAFTHRAMGGMTPQTFSQELPSGLAHPEIGLDHFAFLVLLTSGLFLALSLAW